MSVSVARHPVFLSHAKELEQMLYFTAALQDRLKARNKDSGQMYAEEDPAITLMDNLDAQWIRLIVGYVHRVILKDQRKAG